MCFGLWCGAGQARPGIQYIRTVSPCDNFTGWYYDYMWHCASCVSFVTGSEAHYVSCYVGRSVHERSPKDRVCTTLSSAFLLWFAYVVICWSVPISYDVLLGSSYYEQVMFIMYMMCMVWQVLCVMRACTPCWPDGGTRGRLILLFLSYTWGRSKPEEPVLWVILCFIFYPSAGLCLNWHSYIDI